MEVRYVTRYLVPRDPAHLARRVFSVIVGGALLVVVLAGAMALVSGRWMVTPVLSGSMRPGLAVGGVVIAERVPLESIAVRDVIIFHRPDHPTEEMVHRVIDIQGNNGHLELRTQGDANPVRDPWTLTLKQPYAYRVRWSVPLIGYAAVAYQSSKGFFLMAAGAAALVSTAVVCRTRKRNSEGRTVVTDKVI